MNVNDLNKCLRNLLRNSSRVGTKAEPHMILCDWWFLKRRIKSLTAGFQLLSACLIKYKQIWVHCNPIIIRSCKNIIIYEIMLLTQFQLIGLFLNCRTSAPTLNDRITKSVILRFVMHNLNYQINNWWAL